MPTHVIWDWNGTLLNDVDACVGAINRMLAARSLARIDVTRYRDVFDFPVRSYYERIGFDLANEDWDAMAREFHGHYDELAVQAVLREGATETLTALRDRGLAMSVLSACEINRLESMLTEHRIHGFFDQVFGLDNLNATSKLDQGHLLLETLGVPRGDIVLIGDTNHDHDVAAALGIECILLTGGHQAESRLVATSTIDSPRQLLQLAALA